ncbi:MULTISPECIES: hypothetical protein [unclassified Streptomyces]|uniref:hypothetical protein n=1 Tax=unclassified Streptomyces TaxID=2593676 RepID=UPI002481B134|nr:MULTISPECIES: hypothetical protein [unclassified Streptomyces]MDA5284109.1 hypothetical protein [Streptomyces sp. Isolate_45]MDX2389550.1 hypothetical protein [Streptomyces sp. DK15]
MATVTLLSAGCSSAESGQGGAADGAVKALPVAITGPQPDVHMRGGDALRVRPLPEVGAPFVQKVEHALREDALNTAKVVGETSAKCPDGVMQKAGAVSQCVVTYSGAEIPYEVKISDSYKAGSSIISYTKEPKQGLLVGKLVYQMINENYGSESGRSDASKLACDELPAAKTIDFGADTGFKCQYWGQHANKGKPGFTTLQIKIGGKGYAYSFEEIK